MGGGTGRRDDISMQFASQDFRPCWIFTWCLAAPGDFLYSIIFLNIAVEYRVVSPHCPRGFHRQTGSGSGHGKLYTQ